ncbi:hypothetical protein [Paenibacillus beijingensis]|uniref:Uncharacterized protein n=1 Tax=Paenibacillus beijingensis TaxID=1126833 RepID=A0A0D5NGL9_9BACL|nr:hypothetical protein [Paenibacillus beijingensis]AJY74265.1 hypothetical protein VN24_06325 [Paenibacillus beijingensis]
MSAFQMTTLLVALALFAFVAGSLKLSNYDKGERYLQFWSPLLAFVAGAVFLVAHDAIFAAIEKLLNEYMPQLVPYLFVVMNLAFLALFALVKAIGVFVHRAGRFIARRLKWAVSPVRFVAKRYVALLPKRVHHRLKRRDPNAGMVFFEEHQGTLRVKAEYRHAGLALHYASIVSGFLLAIYFVFAIVPELQPYSDLLPDHLAAAFLLLAECGWFLAGGKGKRQTQPPGTAEDRTNVSYRELFEEYKRLWPSQLLASGIVGDPRELEGKAEAQHGESMQAILQGLVQGRHLLVRDGMFLTASKAIFPALYRLLFQNKKLVLIVESEQDLAPGAEWFYRGIKEAGGPAFAWTAAPLATAVEQNLEADLLLVKTSDLLAETLMDYIQHEHEQHKSDLVVIMMEGEKLFAGHGNPLKLFASRLTGVLGGTPQFVVFSDWAEDLEDAMQKIFGVQADDITIHQSRSRELHYAAVAQDRGMLQQRIMPRLVHRWLDPEAALVIPAIKIGLEEIVVVDYGSMPGRDNIEELSENIVHAVKDYELPNQAADRLRQSIELHAREWSVAERGDALVICRDASHNLIQGIGRWWSAGKDNTIVVVVSPPYLLRDYLAANADFFLQNHRKISSIVPKPAANRKTAYLSMMDRLSRTWLTGMQLQGILRKAGIEESSLADGVRKYAELLGRTSARRDMLEVRFRKRFDRTEGRFKEDMLYRLNPEEAERYKKSVLPTYAVRLESGDTIAHIPGDVYQQYLPGQAASFGGRWYRIARIDDYLQRVELAVEPLTSPHLYKQSRTYAVRKDSVSQPNGSPVRWMIDRFELTFRAEFRSFDVHTNGYFDFSSGINLQSESAVYVPLSEEDQGSRRSYTQGNMLSITIQSLDGEFEQADRLAFTLSYLLNELFVTLYPYNHKCLSVSTALPDSFYAAGKDAARERLLQYVPRLKPANSQGNTKEIVQLYVFEDSLQNLGLIESVIQHWNHYIEILDDYLYWVFKQDGRAGDKENYLRHGGVTLPRDLLLRELAAMMRRWLPAQSLRTLRAQYEQRTAGAVPQADATSAGSSARPSAPTPAQLTESSPAAQPSAPSSGQPSAASSAPSVAPLSAQPTASPSAPSSGHPSAPPQESRPAVAGKGAAAAAAASSADASQQPAAVTGEAKRESKRERARRLRKERIAEEARAAEAEAAASIEFEAADGTVEPSGAVESEMAAVTVMPSATVESSDDRSKPNAKPQLDVPIATHDDLFAVYLDVRGVFLSGLKVRLRERIELSLVSGDGMRERIGTPIVEAPELEPGRQLYGQAVRFPDGVVHIRLAGDTARSDAIAALAHELTHIWQYDSLQLDVIPGEELEGLAKWAEIHVLEQLGYAGKAEKLREGLMDRNDRYGEGFRAVLMKLQEDPVSADPFAIMLAAYGRVKV